MALKDCKFFADINGRQVEMDFDQFRAYLLQDNVMATLAPDLTGKRGKKAGFILTAQKTETAAVKAEESKGGVYPFTEHKKAVQVINSFEEGEFITNGTIIAVKSAISPKALSRIKSAERSKLRPVSKAIHDTWVNSFVKNAQEKASIAGVWQVDEKTSMALLQAETVIVPVDADQLKALYNLVQFDGVKVDYRDIGNAVIVTKNGEPAGAISPFNMNVMERERQITLETLRDVLKKPQSKAPVVPVKTKAVTTKAEATTVKAKASTARAEAPSGNVVTVTAEPADAERIADSVKTQKPDAQGFTKPQRAYLVEKAKEVYKEAQEASESTKFVIKVPGDGQFTVKTPTEANSLHRRLTGDNVPGVDAKDTQVERKPLIAGKKVGKTEIVTIGKAEGGHTPAFRWALQATAPSPARSKPFSRGLFTAKDKKGEFETKGSGAYPIELHEGSATVETILPSGDYITDGYMMVLRSAVTPAGLKKVKFDTSRKNTPNLDSVKSAWDKVVKDASVPAEIAGVFQSETQAGVALIDGPKGIIALNPDLVKSVLDLVKPDGVMVTPDSVEEAVIFTKNGKPVGAVQPLRGSSYKEDELEAALAFTKQESTSRPTLPLSAESLRKVQPSLSKDRAETLIQVLKAMGLPFDRIKLAKGETGAKGTLKQAALDAPASAAVREAAKKWAGVKEIKPAINPRLSTLSDELDQLRDNIERSLSKKSIDELIAMDPLMQMSFGSQDRYPVHLHSRLKATIVAYFSRLFNQPESEFVYNRYSEQWGVPKADLVRQADISTIIYPNENSFLKEKAEKRLGISKKSLLEQGRETFKTGQPVLVEVYHGTGAEGIVGNRFSASLAGKTTGAQSAQRGYFFAGSRHTAESYREQAGFILDPASHTNFTKGVLYKFFVKMSNPLVYSMKGNEWREETFVSIMDRAKAAGHDGVIFTNTYDGGALDNIFTLFHGHENQIKSANPNTYDDQGKLIPQSERFQVETPDIRYQAQAYHATRGLFAPEPGFPNGRFRLDKVNTGLGAQSFGHGIYIAEGKAGVTAYTEMLEEDAPGSVVYELDVPDGIVAKLATYEKPLTPKQFAALKAQVQSMLGEKAARAIAGLDKANTGDLIERIQDAIDSEDAGRQTSEAFSKAGIPGVKVEVSKDFGENKSFYVIWNQAALDRIALMKANEEPLQTALEPTKQEEEAPPLGSIEFIDDLNAVISTFEGANESTILHEGFHFYRRHMLNEANGFTRAEINEFNDWAGAKDGVWTVPAEEKAARGFEKYLRTGLAPTPELKKLFQKVAKWLREVYKTLQGSEIDVDIPDNIRRIFDRIFTLEAERQKGATGTVQAETSASTLPDIRYQKASTGPARLKQEKGGTPEEGPVFVDNVIEALKTWAPKGTPEQLKAHLAKVKGAVAEADWIGLPLFLEGRRSVTRDEVEQFVKDNQVTVREVVLSDEYSDSLRGQPLVQFRDWLQATSLERREFAKRSTVHSRHVLNPKAPAYRELLFLIPPQGARIITAPAGSRVHDPQFQYTSQPMPQEQAERELQERLKQPVRRFVHAGHYRRAKNSVVHVRFNERALADGTKVLFIEEIQSDWAQAKRQGQTDLSTPFQDTSRWTMLAFKRMLRWATDNQYDKIAWTTGTQQATRWSERVPRKPLVRTDVDKIEYKSIDRLGELKNLTVYTTSGKVERYNRVSEETIIREFGEKVYEAMPLINEYGSVNVKELGEKLAAEGESGPSLLSEIASMEVEADYDPNGEDGRRVLWDFTITYKNGDTKSVKNQTYSEIETTYGETLIDFLHSIGGAKTTLTQEELDELAKPEALSGTTKAMLKYYDQIVPTEVAKYVKPFEGKVTREALETGQGVHIVNVTEKMRKLAREGQALFQQKGEGATGEPSATDVFRQKQAETRRKAAEAAMNRLRQATKEGQTKQASPAPSATTPSPKAASSQPKTPGPSPSRPSTAGASTGASGQAGTSKPKVRKTIEQEVKDAIDRARKGKANPNNLPLDERLQRSIRGLADRFARRMVEAEAANIYQSDITLPDGSVVDRQEHFKDTLHNYAKAFLANDADGVTKARAVLEKILPERPPKPKVQKTAAERIKAAIERAERAANRKAASLTTEERIDREVKAFTDRFAKRMVWAKKAGTYTDDVILPDGTVVDRQTFFEQAVNDFMTAYQAGNMAGVSLAKSHMNMATEQVPPDVGFGIHSLRSPLSYSNVVGSYEGVMGPLGAEVSTAFKRFHQEVALKQKTMGEALAELRKVMRENYFPAMRDAGFYGMEAVVTAHIDYIQAMTNFGQSYARLRESTDLFKAPAEYFKARWKFAKQGNMIPGAPQSNAWPMATAMMKAFVYSTKLKFNPKSALMNYSQVILSAGPYFTPAELATVIAKSHRPSVRNRVVDGLRLVDVAVRTTGGREATGQEQKAWWRTGDVFQASSEQTRVIGYLLGEIMADRAAKKQALSEPLRQEIIRDWIEKIEFDNSPWNVAPLFRERGLKGALLQFKPFVQKNMERLLADMARDPKYYSPSESQNLAGKALEKVLPPQIRKYAKLLGYQVALGGVGSVLTAVPGLKPIAGFLIYSGLVAALGKAFGDDDEKAEKVADALYYGAPALVGVDLSNSVGYIETPQGKNIYEQMVNQFLGPTVSTISNVKTQVDELRAEMDKPEPLGRPEQKAAKVERRAWDVAKAITPTARPIEMAATMARGKQPELYLDKPTPLTRGEKIARFAAFNPVRQAKFFEEKGAMDWQKRLAGKVTENPEIKRLEGEPDAKYARRQKMYQSWKPYYTRRMLAEPDFRLLSQEDKDAVLDNLKRNMVEETTKVSPDTDKFDAEEIIKRRLKRRRVED